MCVYEGVPTTRPPRPLSQSQWPLVPPPEYLSHAETGPATVDATVEAEAQKFLGVALGWRSVFENFFSGIHARLPIVARNKLIEEFDVLTGTSNPAAEFSALCLAMHLIQQQPLSGESMVTPLYVAVKGVVSLLEATNRLDIRVVQCRVLVTAYELGHGLHAAAATSISACAKAARLAGLRRREALFDVEGEDQISRAEKRRVWWAIFNLDRYISLLHREALFSTEDPNNSDPLPCDDEPWLMNPSSCNTSNPSLDSPFDASNFGQFARECQISHLAGRVVRHIFDPASNATFQAEEALQLDRTMKSYLPLLGAKQLESGRYCPALAICSSAFMLFYGGSNPEQTEARFAGPTNVSNLEWVANQVDHFSRQCYHENTNADYFSPYAVLSLYQAAVVNSRLLKLTNEVSYSEALASLKEKLGCFAKRWAVADAYLTALEVDPPALLPAIRVE